MPSQPRSLRLVTKADGALPSRFDGGWWPRSPQLAAELPNLVRALTPQLGLVRRIGYNPDVWGLLGRHMTVDGYTARLEGFTGLDSYCLRLTGVTGTMLCLLIVPPDAAEHMGHSALAAACTQNGLSRQILVACGVFSYS
ncbi:hypothetical protein ALI144C_30700 [Actinosynnema sp. ALI-1.44]|uniref:DUF5994 family protein n=1 Tax=Actinosynnema sp. ALI-1.44 TaxID=1933779 RepID=UPI00097C5477|nr:DUF5994 family protein [Actinosynnema sp. ALI-1.44]ONI77809.1 hypothetical protein ALI144C_30700 [Actinosynnema sp. ALI-1.44]